MTGRFLWVAKAFGDLEYAGAQHVDLDLGTEGEMVVVRDWIGSGAGSQRSKVTRSSVLKPPQGRKVNEEPPKLKRANTIPVS